MKQTAVEIAFEKLANQGLLITKDYKNLVVYKQAKEMEKEQIIDAFIGYDSDTEENIEVAKQYYNETFKSEQDAGLE